MSPASRYQSMIGGRHIRHTVTTKEQRVLPLTSQGTDETFRNGIVDVVAAIFQVSEYLIPKVLQVIRVRTATPVSLNRSFSLTR